MGTFVKLGKSFLPFLFAKTFRMQGAPTHIKSGSDAETGGTPHAPPTRARKSALLPY